MTNYDLINMKKLNKYHVGFETDVRYQMLLCKYRSQDCWNTQIANEIRKDDVSQGFENLAVISSGMSSAKED